MGFVIWTRGEEMRFCPGEIAQVQVEVARLAGLVRARESRLEQQYK
jgi:hypothetical protein